MTRMINAACVLLLSTSLAAHSYPERAFSVSTRTPSTIAVHEAEILVYLLPASFVVRAQGMEVGWEFLDHESYNHEDYFVFWVMNATRKHVGSVLIGFFAINKHTADVWDIEIREMVEGKELAFVQSILRRAHNIDEETINTFRARTWRSTP